MNLILMTDFILNQRKIISIKTNCLVDRDLLFFKIVNKYADFLKRSLALGMFVPCDENGNVLKEPERYEQRNSFDEVEMDFDAQELYEYIQAKKRVLFKGFEYVRKSGSLKHYLKLNNSVPFEIDFLNTKVEYFDSWNFELTESAVEQIESI